QSSPAAIASLARRSVRSRSSARPAASSTMPSTWRGPNGDTGSSGSHPPPPKLGPFSSGSTIIGGNSPGSAGPAPLRSGPGPIPLPGPAPGPAPGTAPVPVPGPASGFVPGPAGPGPPGLPGWSGPPGPAGAGTMATVIPPGVRPPALSSTMKSMVPAGMLPSAPTGASGDGLGTKERSCNPAAGSTSPTTTGVPSPRTNWPLAGSGTPVTITVRSCDGWSASVGGGTSVIRAESSPKLASPGTTTDTVGAVGASLTPMIVTTSVVVDVAPSWSRTV